MAAVFELRLTAKLHIVIHTMHIMFLENKLHSVICRVMFLDNLHIFIHPIPSCSSITCCASSWKELIDYYYPIVNVQLLAV